MLAPLGAGPEGARLLKLMTWLSPAFPVGAFSYSHGLEWAIEAGDVRDRAGLVEWIDALLAMGGLGSDAVFFARAHEAAETRDDGRLRDAAELAAAFQPSRERRLESFSQGAAFVSAIRATAPTEALDRLKACWDGPVAYSVAVGATAAGHGVERGPALAAFLHAGVANLVSAAVRLVPLGQTDGQIATAALLPAIEAAADAALAVTDAEEVGAAALAIDLLSMRHETQYTRLFRS